MNPLNKTNEVLVKELQELRAEYNALKALYENDITNYKQVEERSTISETNYRRLFETAKDGIILLDAETGMITDVNPFLVELLGYSKEEFLDKAIWEIGFFKDIVLNKDNFTELQQNEYIRYEDMPLETSEGHKINVEFVSNVYQVNHHNIIQCNIRDITKRKRDEEFLLKLNIAINNSSDVIFMTDKEGTITYINHEFTKMYGFTAEEVVGKVTPRILNSGLYPKEISEQFWSALNNKQSLPATRYQNKCRDGRLIDVEGSAAPILNDNDDIIGFLGIQRDITNRIFIENELIKAKEKAEESDRLKSTFLANMSHEIRTPMNGILGFAGLLKEPNLTGEEQQEYIKIIEKSGVRMLNIINDIVNISKIESGQMEISISKTNVNEQIEFVYSFFKSSVEKNGIQLIAKNALPSKEAIIKSDREKIYAILNNLVGNATKFTHAGSIEFGYEKKGKYLEFFVKDTGDGIADEKKEIIFERFRQGSESMTRNYEGAGLGLSISNAYVEMLGGKIWVESELGKGSTFYFTIPYNAETETEAVSKESVSAGDKDAVIKSLKVLIAEDDESSEIFLSTIFKRFDKELLKARTGVEAVEACHNNPDIDLVLMDVRMPDMDGYEATRIIREFNKDVVIIAQTAYGLLGDREKAIEAGCNDYISKPINVTLLKAIIQKHFKQSN